MTGARRAGLEIVLGCLAVAGCVVSWLHAASTVPVAPVVDGEPPTTSLTYDPAMLMLSLVLATVAGVLFVIGVARLRRVR